MVLQLGFTFGMYFGFLASGGGKFNNGTGSDGGGIDTGDGTGAGEEVVELIRRMLL